MKVHLHTLCWNDATMLGFFFRHYEPWVDRFFIYDDGSTDGTLEALRSHPKVQVEPLVKCDPTSWVLSAKHIYDTSWKRSRGAADWVVVTNIDEHLYHPDMPGYLGACLSNGVTAIPALGYQMLAEHFPPPDAVLARDVTRGAPFRLMSKLGIFRPDQIEETNFGVGRHSADFAGNLVLPERDEVLNLHYKYLGVDYAHRRNETLGGRLGRLDRRRRWGHNYLWSRSAVVRDFEAVHGACVDVHSPAAVLAHREPRWWRADPEGRQCQTSASRMTRLMVFMAIIRSKLMEQWRR